MGKALPPQPDRDAERLAPAGLDAFCGCSAQGHRRLSGLVARSVKVDWRVNPFRGARKGLGAAMIRFPSLVRLPSLIRAGGLFLGIALLAGSASRADVIRNSTATFAGLDKITGRIISFEVSIDETVQFGTLQITPRVCLTRPQTETPLTEGFVEVDEIESVKQAKRIFSGWMFAASPGLHGVEHPVYDVWLKDCKGGLETVATPAPAAPSLNAPPPPNAQAPTKEPRKPRRTITPQNPVDPTVESLPPESPPAPAPAAAEAAPAAPAAAPEGIGAPRILARRWRLGRRPARAGQGPGPSRPSMPRRPIRMRLRPKPRTRAWANSSLSRPSPSPSRGANPSRRRRPIRRRAESACLCSRSGRAICSAIHSGAEVRGSVAPNAKSQPARRRGAGRGNRLGPAAPRPIFCDSRREKSRSRPGFRDAA